MLNATSSKPVRPQFRPQLRDESFGYIGNFRNVSTPRNSGKGRKKNRTKRNRRN